MEDTRYQTFWRRFGANFIDGLLFLPVAAITFPLLLVAHRTGNGWYAVGSTTLGGVLAHSYTILFLWKRGQTVGKMATSVVVVDAVSFGRISLLQAILRSAGDLAFFAVGLALVVAQAVTTDYDFHDTSVGDRLITAASSFWFFLELITMLTNPRRRAVHDLFAGTVVVKKEFLAPRPAFATPSADAEW